ncbi:MAG: SMI1/KNR4 family protein, partial [Bacillota bacterium]
MNNQNIQRLIAIIDSFREQVTKAGNVPLEGINQVEAILGVKLPDEYKVFLNRYGAITIGDLRIYGISYPADSEPSVLWALKGLWKTFPEIPKNLIPIRDLSSSGAVACIQCP